METEQRLRSLRFIPVALPDVNLKDIDTRERFEAGGRTIALLPLAIEVESEDEARRTSADGCRLFYIKRDGRFMLFDDNASALIAKDMAPARVKNGIELAKCMRLGMTPCVIRKHDAGRVHEIEEQLRIAMFLTNSKDTAALKQASVYMVDKW